MVRGKTSRTTDECWTDAKTAGRTSGARTADDYLCGERRANPFVGNRRCAESGARRDAERLPTRASAAARSVARTPAQGIRRCRGHRKPNLDLDETEGHKAERERPRPAEANGKRSLARPIAVPQKGRTVQPTSAYSACRLCDFPSETLPQDFRRTGKSCGNSAGFRTPTQGYVRPCKTALKW